MQHLSNATNRARRLAAKDKRPMAVVHCGGAHYTVKAADLAARHYPAAIRRTIDAAGNVLDNPDFKPEA